jgi:hypothetical protein
MNNVEVSVCNYTQCMHMRLIILLHFNLIEFVTLWSRMWYTGLCWVVRGLKRQLQLTDRRMLWLKEQYLQLYFEECCCGPMTADAIRVGNVCS